MFLGGCARSEAYAVAKSASAGSVQCHTRTISCSPCHTLAGRLLLIYHAQVTMPVSIYPCIMSEDLQYNPTDVLQCLNLRVSEHAS